MSIETPSGDFPLIQLISSAQGDPVGPKRFESVLETGVADEAFLTMLTDMLTQLDVQVRSRTVEIFGYDAPARGFMAEGTYRASQKVFTPYSATDTISPVNGSIRIECAIIRREAGLSLYLTFTDNIWWNHQQAEDWVVDLLFNLIVLFSSTGKVHFKITWNCRYGRWRYERKSPINVGGHMFTLERLNPLLA
jgi:hypothetical protein